MKSRKNYILKTHSVILYLSVMAMLLRSSATIREIGTLNIILIFVQTLSFVYYSINCIWNWKKVSKLTKIFFCIYALLFISTFLGTKDMNAYRAYTIQTIGTICIVEYEMSRNPFDLLKYLRNSLAILLVLNTITTFLFPTGFNSIGTDYYILGLRIGFTPFVALFIMVTLIYDRIKYDKKISIYSILIIGFALLGLLVKSVTTGIVTSLLILLLIFLLYRDKLSFINYWSFLIVYAIIFIGIVFFSFQYKIPYFSNLMVNVLHEDLSFNNRDVIWKSSIEEIKKKPLIGYGISAGGDVLVKFTYNPKVLTSHNEILHILHEGGIVSFILYLLMFILVGKKIEKSKRNYISCITKACMFGFFTMMITEVQSQKCLMFFAIAIAYFTDKYVEIYNKKRKENINE